MRCTPLVSHTPYMMRVYTPGDVRAAERFTQDPNIRCELANSTYAHTHLLVKLQGGRLQRRSMHRVQLVLQVASCPTISAAAAASAALLLLLLLLPAVGKASLVCGQRRLQRALVLTLHHTLHKVWESVGGCGVRE